MAKQSTDFVDALTEELSHALEKDVSEAGDREGEEAEESTSSLTIDDAISSPSNWPAASEVIQSIELEAIPEHPRAESADLSAAVAKCQTGVAELTEYRLRLIENMRSIDTEIQRLQELYGAYRKRVYEVERRERDMQQDMLDLLVAKRRLDSPK